MKLFDTAVFAADHAGFALKQALVAFLLSDPSGSIDVHDCGTHSTESVDYPDYAEKALPIMLQGMAKGKKVCGIFVCGSGLGMAMAANRSTGIRAAVCHDNTIAVWARMHNDANVLVLGGRLVETSASIKIMKTFLETPFQSGRHQRRIDKLDKVKALK